MTGISTKRLFPILLVALITFTLTGCKSTSPRIAESNRIAAVVIHNPAGEEIQSAIKSVFLSHGYASGRAYGDELVYQRRGGFMKSLTHGDWYSGAVWMRIEVYRRELKPGSILVDCDVYLVQEPEDPFMEKKQKLSGTNNEAQALLEEVKKQVGDRVAESH